MSAAGNPLSAGSLATFMAASLPRNEGPQLRTPYEAVALFSHACMIAVGFRLIGLGEDDKIDAHQDAADVHPLPAAWNVSSVVAFRYAHSQSSLEYLIKINRLGSKAVVLGIGLGDEKTASFDVAVDDYLSPSSFPLSLPAIDGAVEASHVRALQDVFISPVRIADLGSLFKLRIIQKLAPGIHKPGYEEDPDASEPRFGGTPSNPHQGIEGPPSHPSFLPSPARPTPFHDPLVQPPRRPFPAGELPPPGFEDEYEVTRPPRPFPPRLGGEGRNPLNIGADDLFPPGLGPYDPLRPSFGPGMPGGFGGGGGMHPTFDDPLFGGVGRGRGDGRAPPGARYDPVGPGDGPPHEPGFRGPRFPGGGGSGPPNPFGGFGGGDFI